MLAASGQRGDYLPGHRHQRSGRSTTDQSAIPGRRLANAPNRQASGAAFVDDPAGAGIGLANDLRNHACMTMARIA